MMFPYFWNLTPLGTQNGTDMNVVPGFALKEEELLGLPNDVREAYRRRNRDLLTATDLYEQSNPNYKRPPSGGA